MIETRVGEDICARCQHFQMKKYPQHAAVGIGRCHGYDVFPARLDNKFLPWGTKSCARFVRATDYEVRQEWVERQQAKRQQAGSTEQGETISRASASIETTRDT